MGELNPELYMVFLPAVGWLLFSLGGTQISTTIKGQKWLRRFVLPTILGLAVGFAITWWQGLLVGCIACASFHQGYGDRASWLKRTLIFLSYGLISLPTGWSLWNIFTPMVAMTLFVLCNLYVEFRDVQADFGKVFVWKAFEGFVGLMIGFQVAFLLAGYGHIW